MSSCNCKTKTKTGDKCKNKSPSNNAKCWLHQANCILYSQSENKSNQHSRSPSPKNKKKCACKTKNGKRQCANSPKGNSKYCYLHGKCIDNEEKSSNDDLRLTPPPLIREVILPSLIGGIKKSSNQKIIKLVNDLLVYLISLDSGSNPKYYCHSEYDSGLTNFERLSNDNAIILKTSLNYKYIPTVMTLFQCIYDKNYYIFENDSGFLDSIDELNLNKELTKSLFEKYDFNSWIQVFNIYNKQFKLDKKNRKIANENIYNNVPPLQNSSQTQKIYTLKNIKNLNNLN
jgi:hypothetical protein